MFCTPATALGLIQAATVKELASPLAALWPRLMALPLTCWVANWAARLIRPVVPETGHPLDSAGGRHVRPAHVLEGRGAGGLVQRQAQEGRGVQVQLPDGVLVERLAEDLQLVHVAVEGDRVVGERGMEVPGAAAVELIIPAAEAGIVGREVAGSCPRSRSSSTRGMWSSSLPALIRWARCRNADRPSSSQRTRVVLLGKRPSLRRDSPCSVQSKSRPDPTLPTGRSPCTSRTSYQASHLAAQPSIALVPLRVVVELAQSPCCWSGRCRSSWSPRWRGPRRAGGSPWSSPFTYSRSLPSSLFRVTATWFHWFSVRTSPLV